MNDFTKNELEDIYDCCEAVYVSAINPRICKEVLDKIQSMIDDYCAHDGEIGIDYPAEKCMKCERILY